MNESTTASNPGPIPFPIDIRSSFWLTFSFEIPSIICSIFLLRHLLCVRNLRQSIHNHAIIILLILSLIYVLISVSSTLSYNQHNRTVWLSSPVYCLIWRFVDSGIYISINVLLAWASFERHILVFHPSLVNSHHKRIVVHYIPMIVLVAYLTIFYVIVIFLYPCENYWDYKSSVCGSACYRLNLILATYELILHGFISIILIAVLNISLFIRVIYQKCRIHQPIQWKKHQKMAIQVLSISSLFLSINFPLYVFIFASMNGWPVNVVASRLLNYFTNHVMMFFPFVCLYTLPKLKEKIKNIINPRRWLRTRQGNVVHS